MKIALFILCLIALGILFAGCILWADRQRVEALKDHTRPKT